MLDNKTPRKKSTGCVFYQLFFDVITENGVIARFILSL